MSEPWSAQGCGGPDHQIVFASMDNQVETVKELRAIICDLRLRLASANSKQKHLAEANRRLKLRARDAQRQADLIAPIASSARRVRLERDELAKQLREECEHRGTGSLTADQCAVLSQFVNPVPTSPETGNVGAYVRNGYLHRIGDGYVLTDLGLEALTNGIARGEVRLGFRAA